MQLAVGRISRSHGIRGDVFVDVRTDDPATRFAVGTTLRTEPPSSSPLVIAAATPHGSGWRLHLEGVDDRNRADELRGVTLVVDSEALPPTGDPDLFHDGDLLGLRVESADGVIGSVLDVRHGAGGSTLVVALLDDREVLVPFVTAIVPVVDVAGGRLVVDPPAGLFDL